MVSASKILTVSYGTFSCTLEGFDEPFSTMKAIAEYFRDLAADDRYFGAEPPTPDAEMLHRIAEREIQRRVESKLGPNGIVLRPEGAHEAGTPEPVPYIAADTLPGEITVQGVSQDELTQAGIAARIVAGHSDIAAEVAPSGPLAVPVAPVVPVAAAPAEPAQPDVALAESVALKLQRIRAASSEARAREAQEPAYTEDQHAQSEADAAVLSDEIESAGESADFGFDLSDTLIGAPELPAPLEVSVETPVVEVSAETPVVEAPVAEVSAETPVVEAPIAAPLAEVSAEAPVAETPVEAPQTPTLPAQPEDDLAAMLARVAGRPSAATAQSALSVAAAPTGGRAFKITPAPEVSSAAEVSAATERSATQSARAARRAARAEAAQRAQAEEALEADARAARRQAIAERREALLAQETEAHARAEAAAAPLDIAAITAAVSAPEAAPEAEPQKVRARVIKVRRPDETPESVVPEPVLPEVVDETEASIAAVLAAAGRSAQPAPAAAAVLASDEEDDLEASLRAALGDLPMEALAPAPLAAAPLAPTPETAAEPRDPFEADFADDIEAELDREFALEDESTEAEPPTETPTPARIERRATPEPDLTAASGFDLHEPGEADLSRLMREANSKLDGAENRRKFDAISHLKAAVAATVADRKIRATQNDDAPSVDSTEVYREDLTRAVRPRRPAANSIREQLARPVPERPVIETKPAPLVLVSEQRVDAAPPAAPVRPRRVSAAELVAREIAVEEDEAPISPEEADDFARFAAGIGAQGLGDLIEAAAAYAQAVEKRPHFTRPQVIGKAAALAGLKRDDREAGLRSFGTLLREGKIAKVKRGQFAITEASRFYKAARQA